MSDIFNYDNKLMQGLDKFFNVCYLSIVWLLACIPIVTIGAANTALYYTANKVLKHNRGYVWKDFWGAFRANFKQSTIVWLVTLGLTLLMCFDTYVMWKFAAAGYGIGKIYIFFYDRTRVRDHVGGICFPIYRTFREYDKGDHEKCAAVGVCTSA